MSTPSTPGPLPRRLVILDAAGPLGDAVVSEAALVGLSPTALARFPQAMTAFSPRVTYSPVPLTGSSVEDLAGTLGDADAVVLTLGDVPAGSGIPADAALADDALTETLVWAMRRATIQRLIVTVSLDAARLTTSGALDPQAPQRTRPLKERVTGLRAMTTRGVAATLGEAGPGRSQRRPELESRRALELARLSGLEVTVLAHPPIQVAPGPAEVTRVPLAYAPKASAVISARDAAHQVLAVLADRSTAGEEYVISEH